MKIIFICTSNVCRSIMAEALLKEKLNNNQDLKEKIEVYSAGTFAQDGDTPMFNVIETMKELRNRYKTIQVNKS